MIKRVPAVLIELKPSSVHKGGVGVFVTSDVRQGQKLADGISEEDYRDLIPWPAVEQYDREVRNKIHDFCVGTLEGFIPPPDLDFNKLSIEWYLNHSCEGNCGFNDDGDFVAIRAIGKGEELNYDYALVESNPSFLMHCTCGSRKCRKVITGNDWKDDEFRFKHREYMHPHLRRLVPIPA